MAQQLPVWRIVCSVILGAVVVVSFAGCSLSGARGALPPARSLVVAADGSGDFTTVQAAVDAIPEGNARRVVIEIRPGIYKEEIVVPETKPFVKFRGARSETTILTFDNYASKKKPGTEEQYGTSGSSSAFIKGDDFIAENVTFENSAGRVGQAVAIRVTGDRGMFLNCRFLGWQDTLYAKSGRQYYRDCYIEGNCDFIFGEARAVFDRCHIHAKDAGYYTAQSRAAEDHYSGYVFNRCRLTGSEPMYLGRPWRDCATVVFLRCWMGECVRPEGWHNWGRPEREKTAFYAEHKSEGPGANPDARVAWSRQLTDEEAGGFAADKFLLGSDGKTDPWLRRVLDVAGIRLDERASRVRRP